MAAPHSNPSTPASAAWVEELEWGATRPGSRYTPHVKRPWTRNQRVLVGIVVLLAILCAVRLIERKHDAARPPPTVQAR